MENGGKSKTSWLRQNRWLLLGAAVGIFLILLGSGVFSGGTAGRRNETVTSEAAEDALSAYIRTTEQKIARLCAQVRGAGRVSVMIGVDGDFTYVYATDRDEKVENGQVCDATTKIVTVGSGSGEQAVLLTREVPRITGIGVVCEGGDDPNVRQEMLSLLSATYGIGTNKIYITGAGTGRQ